MFTIGVIASAEVKADSAVGICFLAPSVPVRIGALLVPMTLVVAIGSLFLVGGEYSSESKGFVSLAGDGWLSRNAPGDGSGFDSGCTQEVKDAGHPYWPWFVFHVEL